MVRTALPRGAPFRPIRRMSRATVQRAASMPSPSEPRGTSGAYLGDACFVMMIPVSQKMGPPGNPARFTLQLSVVSSGPNIIRALPYSGL
ncbi:hypothetical protein F1643_10485 [Azospirillum sp. INR13]|nr:hypothetical protein [Azospirillum sp. INR13]